MAKEVFARQDAGGEGLSHYFLEKDGVDGYRSLAFSCEPALALLRLCELQPAGLEDLAAGVVHELQDPGGDGGGLPGSAG